MQDQFGGVEVEERPQNVDEFGGVSVEEESPVQTPEFPKLAEGATFAQAIRQPTPVGVLPPTSIVPAIKLIGGEIVPGQLGDTHPDIIRREGLEAEDIDKRLFQTPFGPLDRDQAAIATGLRTDFERGQLHSTDLKRALQVRPPDTDLAAFQAPEGVQRQLEEAAAGESPKPLITLPAIPESLKQAYSMPVRALFGDKAADLEVAIADELYNAAKSVPEFLTTEEGMLSVLASANPVGRLGVTAYFTQDMARSVIDQAKRMGEDWDSLSTEGKARRLTQAAATLGFTAALGKAAFGEGVKLVRPTPRVTPPQQIPPVIPPEARPTVPVEAAPSPAPVTKPTPAAPSEGFVQVGGLTQPKIWNWLNKRYGIKQGGKVVMEDFGPGTENVPADTRYSTKLDAEGKPMVDEAGVPVPDKPTRIRINTRAAHTPKTLERYVAEEFGHWYDIENRARSEEIIEGLTPEESANLRATVTKRYEPGVRGFEMRAQGIELLARSWRDRPWFEKFVLEVKNFLSDKLGVRVTDKVMRARAEKVAVRAIMQAAERVRAATPTARPVAPAPVAPVLKSPSEKSTQSIRSLSDEQWDVLTEELIDATDVYATGGSAREGGRRAYELEDKVIAFMESARKEHADKSLSEAFGEFRKSGQASDADLRKIRKILVDSGFMKSGKVSRAPKAAEIAPSALPPSERLAESEIARRNAEWKWLESQPEYQKANNALKALKSKIGNKLIGGINTVAQQKMADRLTAAEDEVADVVDRLLTSKAPKAPEPAAPVPKEVLDAAKTLYKAEKRYRRARRQEPSEVADAEEARIEAEGIFRDLAAKNKVSQDQFDRLLADAKATETDVMAEAEPAAPEPAAAAAVEATKATAAPTVPKPTEPTPVATRVISRPVETRLSPSDKAITPEEKRFRATPEGQKAMQSRASRIGTLLQMNEGIRRIDPNEAYDRGLIETLPDSQIDTWMEDLRQTWNRLKSKPKEPPEGALEARMAREEKPPAGYVRLYRGTKAEGIESPWFTENPERARSFGQFISYVDVPREVAARYRGLIKTDYVLPDELIRQEKHIASPIPQRVWEVESSFQSRIPETIPGDRVVTIEKTDPDGKVSRYVGSWNPEKSYDLRELPQYGRLIPQIGKVTPTGWSHGLLGENERIIDDGGKSAIEEGSFQAKVTPGMGASQAGEKPKAAQIEQLTQALEGVRASKAPIGQQVKQSFSIGERFATARDAIGRAVAGMKTSGDTLISKWKGTENIDDMLRAKGELSKEIEARGWRLRQWERMAKKAIPNPKDQAAIAKWVDAGGDMSVLQEGLRNAPAQYKQAYADALKLSGDKLVAAQNVQNYFDARLQEAIDAGVLEHGVENYIHRMYESRPDLQKKALAYTQGGLLKTNPSMAKKRVFQFDWEAEKAGYRPVQSFIKRITAYEASLTKAIAAREFIKKTTGMKAKDGRPVVDIKGVGIPIEDPAGVYREATLITPKYSSAKSNEPTLPSGADNPNYRGDYVHRDYRALSRWKWVSSDADGKPIFVQGDVAIHPDYVGRIDALLQPSQVRFGKYGKILRPAMQVSSVAKQTMLDLSGFHQVQITVHGMEHKVMPWRIIREIDLSSPDVDGLLKGGLTLGGDYSGAYREGLVGSSLTRLIPGLGNLIESYHQWLFQDYIPRIKTTMALHALERNRSRFSGKMSDEAIFRKTANQANAAFGELNYTMLERSKTAQDISRLILLAPDFLEARGRFAAQAFERGGRGVPLIGGNEQRMALLLGALTMYVTARIANKIIDNQYHEEPENLFNIVYNGHAYGLRTVQGDLLHLLNKPLQFWTSRLNPVYGRTLLEALTGRDYFGRKRSVAEQAWDAASTIVPISLRSSRERSLWESLLNGFGVTARRWSDVDDAFKLSAKWKEQHGVGERGEFIYDPNKDPLRPLKLALNHGDEAGAAKEIKALLDSKAYTIKRLDQYFKRYASMPFAGSKANDKKFIATLTDDQRKTVEAARQHKIELARLYRKSRGQYLAPAVSDTTATPATDEFGGIPLE